MEQEIEEFRARIASLKRSHRGTPYPEDIRDHALRLAARLRATGLGAYAVGRQLGIRPETLASWVPPVPPPRLAPVVVEPSPPTAPAAPETSSIVVTSPSGWRIEGIGVDALVRLARVLP